MGVIEMPKLYTSMVRIAQKIVDPVSAKIVICNDARQEPIPLQKLQHLLLVRQGKGLDNLQRHPFMPLFSKERPLSRMRKGQMPQVMTEGGQAHNPIRLP